MVIGLRKFMSASPYVSSYLKFVLTSVVGTGVIINNTQSSCYSEHQPSGLCHFGPSLSELEAYQANRNRQLLNESRNNPDIKQMNSDHSILDIICNKKKQNYFNHRSCNEHSCKWPYQMKPFLSKQYNSYPLLWKSRCEKFNTSRIHNPIYEEDGRQNWIISDLIMLNKSFNLTKENVERYLGMCRYKNMDNHVQIDRWVYSNNISSSCDDSLPRYTISYNDNNMNKIPLGSTDYDKLMVAKYLIQIMNEIPPEELNFNNYHKIGEWYVKNDLLIQMSNLEMKRVDEFILKSVKKIDIKT